MEGVGGASREGEGRVDGDGSLEAGAAGGRHRSAHGRVAHKGAPARGRVLGSRIVPCPCPDVYSTSSGVGVVYLEAGDKDVLGDVDLEGVSARTIVVGPGGDKLLVTVHGAGALLAGLADVVTTTVGLRSSALALTQHAGLSAVAHGEVIAVGVLVALERRAACRREGACGARIIVGGDGILDIVDPSGVVGLGIPHGLAIVEKVGIGEALNSGAPTSGIVVALSSVTVVGEDRAEVGLGIAPAILVVAVCACTGGALVVVASKVVTNLVPERIIPRGTIPSRDAEHVPDARPQVGNATILRIVDDERHDIGSVHIPEDVSLVDLPVPVVAELTQSRVEGVGARLHVVGVLHVDEVELGVHPAQVVGHVGLLDGEVDP